MTSPAVEDPDADATFAAIRPKLFGVAYRMTGSVADAEDCCQEAWLRWAGADRDEIREPEAWLVRVTTRLAIDRQRSAQRRRETYVGPSLPEPLVLGPLDGPDAGDGDPARAAELADSLTLAFLVLMDELSPDDRAVLLLHDVFGYDFAEVAEAVGRSPAACRQAASRVRRRLAERDGGPSVRSHPGADERGVLERLLGALLAGDVGAVLELLAPDVVELNDGGPSRRAARRPIVGPDRVARLMVNLASRAPDGTAVELVRVNHLPGLVLRVGGRPDLVMSFQLDAGERIRRIWVQLNPDKLAHLR